MRKFGIGLAVSMVVVSFGISWSMAQDLSPIPSYYTHTDFLLTTPGVEGSALGGFVNPAVYGLLPAFEDHFFWSDQGAKLNSLNRWGLFMGVPHLGFGVTHHRKNLLVAGDQTRKVSITDYRIALAGGSEAMNFGLGYGWSRGDVDAFPRDNIFQAGIVGRPHPVVSLGMVGNSTPSWARRTGWRICAGGSVQPWSLCPGSNWWGNIETTRRSPWD
jgi:hypothetical protein